MAQTERMTLRAVKAAEIVHDEFEEAIADGTLCDGEIAWIRRLLDMNLLKSSLADSAVNVGVSAIRGGVGTRHHKSLVADFRRIEDQVESQREPLDAA